MATPRSLLVDSEQPLHYHLVSRCVRRAWLLSDQPKQRKQPKGRKHGKFGNGARRARRRPKRRRADSRRAWIEARTLHLAKAFAVEVMAYSIMSNHFHLVVYYDPLACRQWSEQEVAERYLHAHPPADGDVQRATERLLANPHELARCRAHLGDLSKFMKHLKQPIAVRINREEGTAGNLFEKRFYSGALLNDDAVLAAMCYVDLNPFRADIANFLDDADFTSIQRRLSVRANSKERLEDYLAPLAGDTGSHQCFGPSGDDERTSAPHLTLHAYVELLRQTMACTQAGATDEIPIDSRERRWAQSMELLRKQQRAYGSPEALAAWLQRRHMRPLEKSLP